MTYKILCVDDEQNVLDSIKRQLRKLFTIDIALGGKAGLDMIASQGPYAVVVSDMRMPEMDGVQFLAAVNQKAPNTVRIMLTGNADQQTAIEAINQGHIFRFLNKPCSSEAMAQAIEAGIEHYRLVTAEKELLEKTLRGSIKVLTDVLSLVNPAAFSRASRAKDWVIKICSHMDVKHAWKIEIAAMLSQIGCVTLPPDTVEKMYHNKDLTEEELQMVDAHPSVGEGLVQNIPRLEEVAKIIACQEYRFDGIGPSQNGLSGEDIPLGGRVLKVALDFDTLKSKNRSNIEAFLELRTHASWYDPRVVEALEHSIHDDTTVELQEVRVSQLDSTMVLAQDICTTSGLLIVAKGQEITPVLKDRIKNFSRKSRIQEPIQVYVKN